jgi:chaperone modulatory protein CbpM
MRVELDEFTWFDEHELSFSELCEISGLPPALLEELIEAGAIAPLEVSAREVQFGAAALAAARHARRLREAFELDTPALLLALGLLERLHEMEHRLRELEARTPRRLRG